MLITMRDVRAAKMCSSGSREFFKANGLDWQDFLNHGIEADKLLNTGDAMAAKVVEVATNGRK